MRLLVYLNGTVQGVGMRYFIQQIASKYKITGYVKNLRDGRVEALLEGPENMIEQALKAMQAGPPEAIISDFTTQKLADPTEYQNFKVAF